MCIIYSINPNLIPFAIVPTLTLKVQSINMLILTLYMTFYPSLPIQWFLAQIKLPLFRFHNEISEKIKNYAIFWCFSAAILDPKLAKYYGPATCLARPFDPPSWNRLVCFDFLRRFSVEKCLLNRFWPIERIT